jgi:hypothetical protein
MHIWGCWRVYAHMGLLEGWGSLSSHCQSLPIVAAPRQLMKKRAVGVLAPLISSSVVTMPGLKLCTPTFEMLCILSSAVSDLPSCCRLRLVAPYAAKRGVALPSAPAPSMLKMWPPAGC